LLHLSTIRQHYDSGFRSIVGLVEELEQQIEALTLANQSPNHFQHLERTISNQQEEIKRLSQTVDNKSKELFELYQFNQRLQLKIRELEQTLASDSPSLVRKDSHNSNLPPSLDLPWQKVKRTRSLRTKSGLQIGGQPGHRGFTLPQVNNPDVMIVHHANVCQHCHYSLINIESIRFKKRQIFEIENGKLTVIEHQAEVKLCPFCRKISKGHFPDNLKAPVQYGTSVFSRIVYFNQIILLECLN
jgi:transposase